MLDVGGGALDNPPIEIGGFKMLDVICGQIFSKKKNRAIFSDLATI